MMRYNNVVLRLIALCIAVLCILTACVGEENADADNQAEHTPEVSQKHEVSQTPDVSQTHEAIEEASTQLTNEPPLTEPIDTASEHIELYDLLFEVPAEIEHFWFQGEAMEAHISIVRDGGEELCWLSIYPHRPTSADTRNFAPIVTDESGVPVLTSQAILDIFPFDLEIVEEFDRGTGSIGGLPSAYIDVSLFSVDWPDDIWRIRLTRVVNDVYAYDFRYITLPDLYEKNLPIVEKIIDSAAFWQEYPLVFDTIGNIELTYPTKDTYVSDIPNGFCIIYERYRNDVLHLYIEHDDTILYTDDMLEDQAQVDKLLYSCIRGFNVHGPRELSRSLVDINGIKAVHAIYNDDFRQDNSYEITLFIHDFDLYSMVGVCKLDNEERLRDFMQPIMSSIRYGDLSEEPIDRYVLPTDTVRWINYTYAILTDRNGGDIDLVGGYHQTSKDIEQVRIGLLGSWRIHDRASSDDVIARLIESGHRATFYEFAKDDPMYKLEPEEFYEALEEIPAEMQRLRNIYETTYDSYRLYGDRALFAWDYCRILYLYGSGYLVGYYTYDEAIDLSIEVALELQRMYSSWGEMYRDYLAGYHYWSGGNPSDTKSENFYRLMIMISLVSSNTGPGGLPWDIELVNE